MGLIGSVSPRSLALGCCKRMAVPHSVDLEIDIGEVVASSLRSWAKNFDQVYGAPRLAPWTWGEGGARSGRQSGRGPRSQPFGPLLQPSGRGILVLPGESGPGIPATTLILDQVTSITLAALDTHWPIVNLAGDQSTTSKPPASTFRRLRHEGTPVKAGNIGHFQQ
jgi:hypothetical protein